MKRVLKKIIKRLFPIANKVNKNVDQDVFIGNNCQIAKSKFGRYNKINDYSYLYNVTYGDYTYSAFNVTLQNCIIGKFCSIAQGVGVGLGKHPVNNFVSTHPVFYSTYKQCGFSFADVQYYEEMGTVTIGNDVWIGANSIILDDVNIGNGVIIAANSVVTKDVPPYAVVGGTPAKIIKYRFSDEDVAFLEEFKWWDKDSDWLQENYKLMHDIGALKNKFK